MNLNKNSNMTLNKNTNKTLNKNIKWKRIKKTVRLSCGMMGVVVAVSVFRAPAYAANMNTALSHTGVDSLLHTGFTEEEYLKAAEQIKESQWGYTNLGIANVESGNLNVRKTPDKSGKLVGKMSKGSVCEVLETSEDGLWAHILSGEVEGYVSTEFLYTGADAKVRAKDLVRTVAVVNVDALKVRDEANMESAVLTMVPKEEELDVEEVLQDWVKVQIDGLSAYVSKEYVTVKEKLDTAITMSELLYGQGVSDLRVDIVEYAKQFVGNPYKWGGTSLTKGTDCSGFTMSVYKHFGIKISRTSKTQANEGRKISQNELQPGDLIFYANSGGSINHVTLYIGGGKVVHASTEKTGIKISKYNYRTPVKYVSILQDE